VKKYRLGYDYLFLSSKPFHYKGELIGAMSINVLFKVFYEGEEQLFESEEFLIDQKIQLDNGKTCYLSDLIRCSIDKKNIINFNPNMSLIRNLDYSLSWEIDFYTKELSKGKLEPTEISEAEFMDILKNNIALFDISNNHPAQTTSYFTKEMGTSLSINEKVI
jgi:hypothetical protein